MKISKQLFQWMDEVYLKENRVLTKEEIEAAHKLLKENVSKQERDSLLNESKENDTILNRWETLAGLENSND